MIARTRHFLAPALVLVLLAAAFFISRPPHVRLSLNSITLEGTDFFLLPPSGRVSLVPIVEGIGTNNFQRLWVGLRLPELLLTNSVRNGWKQARLPAGAIGLDLLANPTREARFSRAEKPGEFGIGALFPEISFPLADYAVIDVSIAVGIGSQTLKTSRVCVGISPKLSSPLHYRGDEARRLASQAADNHPEPTFSRPWDK